MYDNCRLCAISYIHVRISYTQSSDHTLTCVFMYSDVRRLTIMVVIVHHTFSDVAHGNEYASVHPQGVLGQFSWPSGFKLLKWKRIGKDCRDTYYQSCKLTKFANREASRNLWQSFVSAEYDHYEKMIGSQKSEVTLGDADVVSRENQIVIQNESCCYRCQRSTRSSI